MKQDAPREALVRLIQARFTGNLLSIEELTSNPDYSNYLGIPSNVSRFLSDYRINHDPEEVIGRTGLFYVWLKTVDDQIDLKGIDGIVFLDRFRNKSGGSDDDLAVVLTDAIREMMGDEPEEFSQTLEELYRVDKAQNEARNMLEFIEQRKASGRLVAKATLQTIQGYADITSRFANYFSLLGEFGNLTDSSLDMVSGRDKFGFEIGPREMSALFLATLKSGTKVAYKHPYSFFKNGTRISLRAVNGFIKESMSPDRAYIALGLHSPHL